MVVHLCLPGLSGLDLIGPSTDGRDQGRWHTLIATGRSWSTQTKSSYEQ
jgi:hypothetical protein